MGINESAKAEISKLIQETLQGKSLADFQKEPAIDAEIVHTGSKLIVPEGVSLKQAKNLIERRMTYEEETVDLSCTFDVFPWDGAHAFDAVLTRIYGWTPAEAQQTFWGPVPPKMITIDVAYGKRKAVPWGQFSLPNVEGLLSTSYALKDGRYCFQLTAEVKRVSQSVVEKIFEAVRDYLKTGSIYNGQAIRMRFKDDDGDTLPMPEPKFMDTSDIDEDQLVYSRTVTNAIEVNLFTPIKKVRELKANGIQVKRGVLLGGPYGTGKTLAARVASKHAVDAGVTFLYVTRADELANALQFARQYENPACVIFCEDIDRVMDGERDMEMDDILNIIDGIDSKRSNIITVLTTNNFDGIHAAMLRPGRLDAVIEVRPPDAEAVQRLLRVYGGDAIDSSEDLTAVGMILEGHIPAVIAEVVKRAKLSQLALNEPGVPVTNLSSRALESAAESMTMQLDLLEANSLGEPAKPMLDQVLSDLVEERVKKAIEPALSEIKNAIENA